MPRVAVRNGAIRPKKGRVVIVASRFNAFVTRKLAEGARRALIAGGIRPSGITLLWTPGAFELPATAAWAVAAHRPCGVVAVGCLIKGKTPQYEAIGQAVANGLMLVSVNERVPVGFGVIIAETTAQAEARAGGRDGNRGAEAARAVLDVLTLQATHA